MPRPLVRMGFAVALAVTVGLAGCGRSASNGAALEIDASLGVERGLRDVVLITIDTLRHDATGFSGAGRVETPTIDRLAAGGIVFPEAHAHAVVTLPSHASLLSGLYPYQHGIRDNAGFVLNPQTPTLASILRGKGFVTGAFVSAFPLDRRFGLATGFDVYDDEYQRIGARPFIIPERPGAETVARAKAWWESQRGRRRFLWVHLFAPHFPYEPTEPHASRHRDQPYYGEAAVADAELAALLDPLLSGAEAPSLVVLTSDHGESLGEHGERTHGLFAYEGTLKVPLVFWAPGMLGHGIDRRPAYHVDVLPTVLDLLGIDGPRDLPGRPLTRPREPEANDRGYFEALSGHLNRGWAPLAGRIEDGRRKAIRLPIAELYDLRDDPRESTNLAGAQPETLARVLAPIPAATLDTPKRTVIDAETMDRLRTLGYLAANDTPSGATDASLDPKNLIGIEAKLDEAAALYRGGDADGAVRLLEQVVAEQPKLSVAWQQLGMIHADAGRFDRAVEVLEAALAAGVTDESTRTLLALQLERAGRPKDAWRLLERDSESRNPRTQASLGTILASLGRMDEAEARFLRALEIDPTYPDAMLELGLLDVRRHRPEPARVWLERAVQGNPSLARGWNALGVVRMESGDLVGAVEAWGQAARVDPAFPDPLFNLGLALAKSGDRDRAIAALERYVLLVDGERRRRGQLLLDALRRRTANR